MKDIYIVLTYTGSVLSRIVKYYTKDRYSHVSIGLDVDLKKLYSFGRLKPYNPYRAGFVHEEINSGTFARFKNTIGAVYSFKVTDEEYFKISYDIERMKENKDKYKFNIIGLFLVSINRKYKREDCFYCAEFVKYILEQTLNKNLLPEIVKPMDFLSLENMELIYEGFIKNYKYDYKSYEISRKSAIA